MVLFSFQMCCGYSPCTPETMFCTEDCSVLRVSALMCNYGKHALNKSFLKYSKVQTLLAVARQVSESPPGFLVCVCVCFCLCACCPTLHGCSDNLNGDLKQYVFVCIKMDKPNCSFAVAQNDTPIKGTGLTACTSVSV